MSQKKILINNIKKNNTNQKNNNTSTFESESKPQNFRLNNLLKDNNKFINEIEQRIKKVVGENKINNFV